MIKNFDLKKSVRSVVDLKKLKKEASVVNFSSQSERKFASTDFKNYPTANRSAKKKGFTILTFLIILLVLLVASAIAGFFVFSEKGPATKSLKLTFDTPKEAVAGEDFSFTLAYENLDNVSLTQMEMVIEYPENFYFIKANISPQNSEKNVWKLEPIKAGEKKEIHVSGYLTGEIKEEKEFRVIFHYRPENFSSDFQEDIIKKVVINKSLLDVNVEAPELIEDGAIAELKVSCQNNTPEPLADLVLSFDVGDAFLITETMPAASGTTWQIKTLEPNQNETILVRGKIDTALANPFSWSFKIWQKTPNGEDHYFYQKTGKINVQAPKVALTLSLDDVEQKINWGETVNYKITLENNGEIPIKQPVLKLIFSSGIIDWSKFNNQNNATVDEAKNSLIWISTNGGWANNLSELKPGDKLETTVAIFLQEEPADLANLNADELAINALATMTFKSQEEQKVINSENLIKNINSASKLIAEAKYYLDKQTAVGTGPLPPVIGQTTGYRIYWKLFSGSNGLLNVKVKTTLPAYINWEENGSSVTYGSNLKFDSSKRELVWLIDKIAANSQVMADFSVTVTPQESQVNQLLILTNPTSLEAEEQGAGLVAKTTNLLTSDLINDPFGQGKGRVNVGAD